METVHQAKVVTIGGGTGSFTLLSSLKHHFPNLTAIVTMADDGGSTGILRDELGVLPPGDVRQCLVALSDDNKSQTLRELFNFRFQEGSLAGHSFGNLFLSAIEKMTNDFDSAIALASSILNIHGRIVPITHDNVRLAMAWNGEVVHGEGMIDQMEFGARTKIKPHVFLEPSARINPAAVQAIKEADIVVVCPGDLYTSLGALLVVDGAGEALTASKALVVYVSNLSTNPRQTPDWTVTDYANELERLAGSEFIDIVLYNTATPTADQLHRYVEQGENPVILPADVSEHLHYKLLGRDLISREILSAAHGDKLASHRSYIRHDGELVSQVLFELLSHGENEKSSQV